MPAIRPNIPVTYRELAKAIRCHCLQMTHCGKGGHGGSMLSMADLLAALYTSILKVDQANPKWPERDGDCNEGSTWSNAGMNAQYSAELQALSDIEYAKETCDIHNQKLFLTDSTNS